MLVMRKAHRTPLGRFLGEDEQQDHEREGRPRQSRHREILLQGTVLRPCRPDGHSLAVQEVLDKD